MSNINDTKIFDGSAIQRKHRQANICQRYPLYRGKWRQMKGGAGFHGITGI